MAGGRCLVLAGDKGYVNEEEMSGQRDPHIAYHGSLSCMVSMYLSRDEVGLEVKGVACISLEIRVQGLGVLGTWRGYP